MCQNCSLVEAIPNQEMSRWCDYGKHEWVTDVDIEIRIRVLEKSLYNIHDQYKAKDKRLRSEVEDLKRLIGNIVNLLDEQCDKWGA